MVYFWKYVILYLEKHVYQYISLYFTLISFMVILVWSYSTQRNIDRIIKLQKRSIRIITYWEFTERTGPIFSKLKLLKGKDIFY